MRRLISVFICLFMLMSIAPISALAMEEQDIEVMVVSSEDEIVPYANPTNLYYSENTSVMQGSPVGINVTPTKGRSLRVWLLVKSGSVQMKVTRPGLIGYVTEFDKTYGTGDRDVQTVAKCNGNTYQVQFWNKSPDLVSNISMLIYETGG